MNNYEYIVASMPDIRPGWNFGDKGPDAYIGEIRELCSDRDRELVDLLLSGYDDSNLNEEFYRKVTSHRNRFIREYFSFDMNVRNMKVQYLNRSLGRPAEKDVMVLSEEPAEFGEAPAVAAVLSKEDILSRERGLDDIMWEKIDSITTFDYFDIEAILGFIAKLQIVARWFRLDEQQGREMFRKLVEEVRGTFKGVEYE